MSGIESGFTFNGRHCMHDFGLLFVEDNGGRVITHARRVNEYEIAGSSGTIVFPGEVFEPARLGGALFPMTSPRDEVEAQALMRTVGAWLYGPRGQLIFDYEPEKYRIAEVTGESKWSYRSWMDGGLEIEFRIQPYAYALWPSTVRGTVTGTRTFQLSLGTGIAAPLECEITNTGTAAMTGAAVQYGSKYWIFEGMSIAPNGVLRISCEKPIGATITQGGVTVNALPYATQFDMIELGNGTASLGVALTFGSGTPGADAALYARGRWL